jgi:hypothetical protein
MFIKTENMRMKPAFQPTPGLCIIVLREVLIAHDLSTMIADARPDLTVRWAATHDEAMLHLGEGARVAMAFVSPPPHTFAPTALSTRIAQDNGFLVYLGYDANEDPQADRQMKVNALPYPFAQSDVLDVLACLPTN